MDPFSSSPFEAPADDDGASHRQEARDSLFLMADLRAAGHPVVPVRVRNLSAGGLMAEFTGALDVGSVVEFDVRGIGWVAGHVAWRAAGRIGVAFDSHIDPMLARKPVGGSSKPGSVLRRS